MSGPVLPGDLDRLLHDLRGPLNSAVMHAEVIKRLGPDDPASRQSLETIQQELGRLAAMLPVAFQVASLECHDMALVDLGAVVERGLAEHGVKGATLAPGPWPVVRGDARLLGLAVAHLVCNALEATDAGSGARPPEVSFATPAPGLVAVVVRDWGVGFRSTNARAMLRLSASTKPGRTGVGLMTADRVARLHGGTLELSSPAGGGAEVRLILAAPDTPTER
jgi:signal transduction histidine kinase